MLARLGRVLYWTGTAIAIPIALWSVAALIWDGDGARALAVFALPIAGVVWLAGRAALYIFSGD